MITIDVRTDAVRAALLRYVVELEGVARQALADGGLAAIDSARETIAATTTRRTGSLEDDWFVGWTGKYERKVVNYSGHATFIDRGTRPHIIRARRAKALRFMINGEVLFRKMVQHPGTKARPFMALAYAAGQMAMGASAREGADRLGAGF